MWASTLQYYKFYYDFVGHCGKATRGSTLAAAIDYERNIMNGQKRSDIAIGAKVSIVLKADQRTGKRTEGIVAKLLTKSPNHPHGIKVMLEDGQVGRVQEIL